MPGKGDRWLDSRTFEYRGRLARDFRRKKKRLTVPERKPYVTSEIAPAPERKTPVAAPEASPFEYKDTEADDNFIDAPSEFDLAEELGSSMPVLDEDIIPDDGKELPPLELVEQRIPEKTRVLMEELFRAKLNKVQRINPKKIK
ncbi:hypothetical protein [Pelagicoccus sp. SDUM812002]|uniref:hypothetical protein n=1 Tax=Pelagicoccus sp. SDUM812002 TaxID=3041266 RepID=UPI0028102557|nr:hypothetical protein [Pelagicoccus sp. SDUM812002]MDQ8187558.1 hypothetical protein [Pelagicoccus sp. SDUM812002]